MSDKEDPNRTMLNASLSSSERGNESDPTADTGGEPSQILRVRELMLQMEEMSRIMEATRLELQTAREAREQADEARFRIEQEIAVMRKNVGRTTTTSAQQMPLMPPQQPHQQVPQQPPAQPPPQQSQHPLSQQQEPHQPLLVHSSLPPAQDGVQNVQIADSASGSCASVSMSVSASPLYTQSATTSAMSKLTTSANTMPSSRINNQQGFLRHRYDLNGGCEGAASLLTSGGQPFSSHQSTIGSHPTNPYPFSSSYPESTLSHQLLPAFASRPILCIYRCLGPANSAEPVICSHNMMTHSRQPSASYQEQQHSAMQLSSNPHMPYASGGIPVSSASPMSSASMQIGAVPFQQPTTMFSRQKLMDLPVFSGIPEEWPAFYASYCQSTMSFGYTTLDNLYRLQKSLVGQAREVVAPLLIHHENVERVVSNLAFQFGRPEQLADSQLAKVRAVDPFTERQIELLVPFASKVENLVAFLSSGQCQYELVNPSLLKELIKKLPKSKRLEWTQQTAYVIPRATIVEFSRWLSLEAQYVTLALTDDQPAEHHQSTKQQQQHRAQKQGRPAFMHVSEQTPPNMPFLCSFCSKPHRTSECNQFRGWTMEKRWTEVKNNRLCFLCLRKGHYTNDCRSERFCEVNGCTKSHHPLLHADQSEQSNEVNAVQPSRNPFARSSSTRPAETSNATMTSSARENNLMITPHRSQPNDEQSHPITASTNIDAPGQAASQSVAQTMPADTHQPATASFNLCNGETQSLPLLFRIVPVMLRNNTKAVSTFAMFDEGSAISLIDADLAKELELSGPPEQIDLQWFGNHSQSVQSSSVSFEISGVRQSHQLYKMDKVKTVPNLSLPTQTVRLANIQNSHRCINHLPLQEYSNALPKLLIGLDYSHLASPKRTIRGSESGPTVVNTNLGWIVYGRQMSTRTNTPDHCMLTRPCSKMEDLDQLVRDYLSTESFGVKPSTRVLESADNARARRLLSETTRRIGERFQTGLLWRHDDVQFPESYPMALRRLLTVERKMSREPEYAALYCANIVNYVQKGYARRLSDAESAMTGPRTWYLPHFGVVSAHKPGKVRMVFDAAASVNGVSLNSMLLSGPDENPPLTEVLLKFRIGPVAICGDIREMYHQVVIQPEDRCAQRFLWREGDASRPPDIYEMVAMTFGATCSPAAAQFIKNLNADEQSSEFPAAIEPIKCRHYVDDYVASYATVAEAAQVTAAVIEVHRRGGFEIRNFVSNNVNVLESIGVPAASMLIQMQPDSPTAADRILGMCWDTLSDDFRFQPTFANFDANVMSARQLPTKRQVVGISMSVFDPFGILANFMLEAKLLVQDLWRAGTNWDEIIPQSLAKRWTQWCLQLESLSACRIPRCYSQHMMTSTNVQLHVFADASELAFAAVAYWRVQHENGFTVSFIIGKTKCAPVKLLSIPRLELQAAVLATRLLAVIRADHDFRIDQTVLWTDSRTVMQWIRSDHRRYKPFVAHRVAEILEDTTEANWRWLPTGQNVADDATRPNSQPKFDNNSRWLRGPAFLQSAETHWPREAIAGPDSADVEELRPRFLGIVTTKVTTFINLYDFSFYGRLRRAAAWVLRFTNNLRAKQQRRVCGSGELTVIEIDKAELMLCRLTQAEAFPCEYSNLSRNQPIEPSSAIRSLMPFVDAQGTMRVYGRADATEAAFLPESAKHPIILPQRHRLTWLIIDFYHRRMCHQNDSAIVCAVRLKFWVPHLRAAVRRSRRECSMCKIRTARPMPPVMGQLPADRVTPHVRPFTFTGLDFFGPLLVTVGRRQEKRWAALFTCLTVRAVHIELAADLSADACLLCVRNFANIRGVPIRIRSDNGTNFIGASKIVRDSPDFFDDVKMRREMSTLGIEWVFNSPGHPEAGGCWERLVQCIKRVLVTTLSETAPRVETLRTLLIEAANVVNSRPLTHVPVSPDDEAPITPNHFLIGTGSSTTVPCDLDSKVWCLRKQWRIAQQLTTRFWSSWVKMYLPELTRRTKWHTERPPLRVNDLVLVCDANQSRNQWRRGRVVTIFPGPDGRIRNAEVKTAEGILRRPVSKLAILDIAGNEPQT